MNRATSVYLDIVRLAAALAVVFTHLAYKRFSGGSIIELRGYGNDAVMVFFVLSGYVIAYTASTKDRTLREYTLSRCARLYSVALPAILVTVMLDTIGRHFDASIYSGAFYQDTQPWLRILLASVFCNELWFSSFRVFSNGPYWSLGYEAWYYVIFAGAFYLQGRQRQLWVVVALLIAGPKIVLLLPIWLLGLLVFEVNRRVRIAVSTGWILFIGSIGLYILFRAYGGRDALLELTYDLLGRKFVRSGLRWSDEFLSSYLIGPLVAMNFIGFYAISDRLAGLFERIRKPGQFWAGFTFSIYLYHYPLLQCIAAVTGHDPYSTLRICLLLLLTLAFCCLFGLVTEHKKTELRRWLERRLSDFDGSRQQA